MLPIVGAATITLDGLAVSGAGVVPIVGATAITLDDLTLSAAGAVADVRRLKPYRTWRERIGSSEDEPIRAIERRRREEEEIILL